MGVGLCNAIVKNNPTVWITREKLWINEVNWGKLAILFENSFFNTPYIWGVFDQPA